MSKVEPEHTTIGPGAPSGKHPELHHHHTMKQRVADMIHSIHLSPGHKLLTDEKVLKSSMNALKFAIFADALCAQILQPKFAQMITPGAHKDSWSNTDPFDQTAAQYFLPGAAGVATAFAAIGFGALSDKVGRRPCMLLCLYAGAFGSALKYFMRGTFWGFSIANFINGLFGASSVVGMAYVSDVYPHDKKKKEEEMGGIMGIYMLSMNLGGIIAILMTEQGLFEALWIGVALSFVAALWLQFELVEPDRGLHHETDAKTDSATETDPSPDDKKEGGEEEGAAPKTLNKKLLMIIVVGSVIDNIGSSGPMFGVYPVMWDTFGGDWEGYASDVEKCMTSELDCSACMSFDNATQTYFCDLPDEPNPPMSFNSYEWVSTLFGLGILPTLIISGPVYAKLGFGGGCVLGNFLTAVHCIILLYMGNMDATKTNFGLYVFAVYFGFPFTYLSQFTTGPLLDAITPEDMRGTINGVNNFAMSIAMSLAPFLLGLLGDAKGNEFLVRRPEPRRLARPRAPKTNPRRRHPRGRRSSHDENNHDNPPCVPVQMWLCAGISIFACFANAPLSFYSIFNPKPPKPPNAMALLGEDKDIVARALKGEWVPAAELDKINMDRMTKGEPFLRLHYGKYEDDKDNLPILREKAKSDFTYFKESATKWIAELEDADARKSTVEMINASRATPAEIKESDAELSAWFTDYLNANGYWTEDNPATMKQMIMAAFPPINDGKGITSDNILPTLIKMLKFMNKQIDLVDEPANHWKLLAAHAGAGKKSKTS